MPEQRMERARAGESVLLVDDQAYVLQSARRLLESLGYRVEARDSGGAALECLEGEKNDFSVAILDLDMPGMGGLELADRIRERRPGMPILFLSGVIDESKLAAGRDRGHGLVAKPVSLGDLARAVRQAIEQEAWGKAPAGGSASLP